jgi:hypothetical protein
MGPEMGTAMVEVILRPETEMGTGMETAMAMVTLLRLPVRLHQVTEMGMGVEEEMGTETAMAMVVTHHPPLLPHLGMETGTETAMGAGTETAMVVIILLLRSLPPKNSYLPLKMPSSSR